MKRCLKHTLRAATLLELLIVMAASGIVFASAGKCYEIVFKQTGIVKQVLNDVEEAHRLFYMLNRDVFRAGVIQKEGEGSVVMSNDSLPVQYIFEPDHILRKLPARTDTFHIKATELELKQLEAIRTRDDLYLLEKLQFKAKVLGREELFVFRKRYTAETLLNLASDDTP